MIYGMISLNFIFIWHFCFVFLKSKKNYIKNVRFCGFVFSFYHLASEFARFIQTVVWI